MTEDQSGGFTPAPEPLDPDDPLFCGNEICHARPAACDDNGNAPGDCVCCGVWNRALRRFTNSRCMTPEACRSLGEPWRVVS